MSYSVGLISSNERVKHQVLKVQVFSLLANQFHLQFPITMFVYLLFKLMSS